MIQKPLSNETLVNYFVIFLPPYWPYLWPIATETLTVGTRGREGGREGTTDLTSRFIVFIYFQIIPFQ